MGPIATKQGSRAAGKAVSKGLLSKDALRQAGLDWEVKKVPLFYGGKTAGTKLVDGKMGVLRTDNDGYLGTVGQGWTPVQNLDAFEFMDGAFGKVPGLEWVRAGEFKGGELVFLQLKTGNMRVKGDDTVDQILTFTNWHNGMGAVHGSHVAKRIACDNQLNAIINSTSRGAGMGYDKNGGTFRFAHTLNVLNRMQEAERMLAESSAYFKTFFERAKFLAGEDVPNAKWVDEFLKKLEITGSGKKEGGESVKDRRVEKIKELFETGRGNQLPGVGGTVWALYNGVTEYFDHYAEVKKGSDYKDKDEARQYAASYGYTRRIKEQAFDVALEMAGKL